MIYEMRTTDIKPSYLPEVEKRFGEAYEHRKQHSRLAACWHTEFGGLNKFIHIWGYPTVEARNETRNKAAATGYWPPSAYAKNQNVPGYKLVAQENKLLVPSAFSPLQ